MADPVALTLKEEAGVPLNVTAVDPARLFPRMVTGALPSRRSGAW